MDTIGALAALFSLFSGAGRTATELVQVIETFVRGNVKIKFRVLVVPRLAAIAQHALYAACIIIAALFIGAAAMSNSAPGEFIWQHKYLFVFVAACVCTMLAVSEYQSGAIPEYIRDARGRVERYPQVSPKTGRRHPLAGWQRINTDRFKPEKLALVATISLVFASPFIIGLRTMFIAHSEKNWAMFMEGAFAVWVATTFVFIIVRILAWLVATITKPGAWGIRTALSQVLVLFKGITSDNVNEQTRAIQGPSDDEMRRSINRYYAGVVIPCVFGTFFIAGTGFDPWTTRVFIITYCPILAGSLIHEYYCENKELERRRWIAGKMTLLLAVPTLVTAIVAFMSEDTRSRLFLPIELYWGFLLGRYCLPVSDGSSWHLLFSLVAFAVIIWLLIKFFGVWKDWAKWAKIVSGIVIGIFFILVPVRYLFAIGAWIGDEAEVCMPGSGLTPAKAETSAPEPSTATTRWWPAPTAETPRAPAQRHEAPQARHRYSDGNPSDLDPSFRKQVERMRANGEL